ncbi:MAG: TVP38/TMEM64 family protein [Candidatus Hodarchaeales archaeon]
MDFFTEFYIALQNLVADAGFLGLTIAMIIQSIISPIPSELVLGIAGASYSSRYGVELGVFYAFIFSFIGSIIGAIFCHQIGFYLEKFVEKRVTKEEIGLFKDWIEKYGLLALIITRLIPFIPFDAISYVAGIVKMNRKLFIIGTAIGLIPRIIFYLLLGAGLAPILEKDFFLGLMIIALIVTFLFVLLFSAKKGYNSNINKKKCK